MKFLVTIKSVLPAVIGVLALGMGSTSIFAATVTTTFQVTANVQATCSISASAMPFGTYTGGLEWAINGQLTVVCSNGVPYNIGLNAGLGPGATVTSRAMTGPGSAVLNYGLFQDAAFSTNWGNTPGTDTVSRTGQGGSQFIPVFGMIPLGQFVAPGAYADTITATVTF